MAEVARQDRQAVMPRGRRDHDIGKSRRMALLARPVRQGTGDPRRRGVESEDAITVKMQHGLKPCRQSPALLRRPLTPELGDAILDLRDCHRREKQLSRVLVHPRDEPGRHGPSRRAGAPAEMILVSIRYTGA